MGKIRPLARTKGLTAEEVDGELLIYNELGEPVLRLNGPAALVWRSIDGKRTVSDLVAVLADQLGELADEDQVLIALDELAKHDLIASGYERRDPSAERFSRRQFIRRVGIVAASAALAVPIVNSLIVPAAAANHFAGYPYYYPYYPGHHHHHKKDKDDDKDKDKDKDDDD